MDGSSLPEQQKIAEFVIDTCFLRKVHAAEIQPDFLENPIGSGETARPWDRLLSLFANAGCDNVLPEMVALETVQLLHDLTDLNNAFKDLNQTHPGDESIKIMLPLLKKSVRLGQIRITVASPEDQSPSAQKLRAIHKVCKEFNKESAILRQGRHKRTKNGRDPKREIEEFSHIRGGAIAHIARTLPGKDYGEQACREYIRSCKIDVPVFFLSQDNNALKMMRQETSAHDVSVLLFLHACREEGIFPLLGIAADKTDAYFEYAVKKAYNKTTFDPQALDRTIKHDQKQLQALRAVLKQVKAKAEFALQMPAVPEPTPPKAQQARQQRLANRYADFGFGNGKSG